MSGLFITLWDNTSEKFDKILRPTKGGYPHITCFYSGKNISKDDLVNMAIENSKKIFNMKNVTIEKGKVNSWGDRHDVLLEISKDDYPVLDELRKAGSDIGKIYPMGGKCYHTTVGIYHNKEDAVKHLKKVSKFLPLKVEVTGYTLN